MKCDSKRVLSFLLSVICVLGLKVSLNNRIIKEHQKENENLINQIIDVADETIGYVDEIDKLNGNNVHLLKDIDVVSITEDEDVNYYVCYNLESNDNLDDVMYSYFSDVPVNDISSSLVKRDYYSVGNSKVILSSQTAMGKGNGYYAYVTVSKVSGGIVVDKTVLNENGFDNYHSYTLSEGNKTIKVTPLSDFLSFSDLCECYTVSEMKELEQNINNENSLKKVR